MALPDPVEYVPASHCMHDAEIDAPVHPIQGFIVHPIQGFFRFPFRRIEDHTLHSSATLITAYKQGSLRHQEQADLKSSQNIVAQNNYASRTSCSGKGP